MYDPMRVVYQKKVELPEQEQKRHRRKKQVLAIGLPLVKEIRGTTHGID